MNLRGLADPVGFAHTAEQMERLMSRIEASQSDRIQEAIDRSGASPETTWRVAISPHDDYSYVGFLYPASLRNLRARTVILFGVAHKARTLGLENVLIFDSYTHWSGPYGDVIVSSLREEIMRGLPDDLYLVHDKMQTIEHSVEAIVPFLQHYDRDVEIVSILVPAMPYERMNEVAARLAESIGAAVRGRGWRWGTDYAIVISTDAVHYGDEEWGGRNFAEFGTDEHGYRRAIEFEQSIIDDCLTGELEPKRVEAFTRRTVREDDFREYKWTWCGRYSVPCGLLAAWHLARLLDEPPLVGRRIDYATSIDGRQHIPVDDLGMGLTAPAHLRHWVGYVGVGFP